MPTMQFKARETPKRGRLELQKMRVHLYRRRLYSVDQTGHSS